jgi:hypothetical protein
MCTDTRTVSMAHLMHHKDHKQIKITRRRLIPANLMLVNGELKKKKKDRG